MPKTDLPETPSSQEQPAGDPRLKAALERLAKQQEEAQFRIDEAIARAWHQISGGAEPLGAIRRAAARGRWGG